MVLIGILYYQNEKTIYIDLRNSNVPKQEKSQHDQQSIDAINSISQEISSSESESNRSSE